MHRIVALTFFVILGLIMGCNSGSKVASGVPAVLDVSAAPAPIPSAEPSPLPTPSLAAIPDGPAVAFAAPTPATPVVPVALTTASPAPASASAAKSYKVKKGDTLFSIARTQLGSGRDWQKIAAANPGLTPAKLRAGQQIAMP